MKLFTAGTTYSASSNNAFDAQEKDVTTATVQSVPSADSHRQLLRIHAARLTQFGERDYSVMKVSELDDYASSDPIIKAFTSSAQKFI